jgi:hypothetical protein
MFGTDIQIRKIKHVMLQGECRSMVIKEFCVHASDDMKA